MISHLPRQSTRAAETLHGLVSWSRVMAWNGLALRWILLLLLAFDQFGAPLHGHHHDSGIDGSALATLRHAEASSASISAPCQTQGRSTLFHASTPIRIHESPSVDADRLDDVCSSWTDMLGALVAMWPNSPAALGLGVHPVELWPPRERYPSFPPDTRAPPRHA